MTLHTMTRPLGLALCGGEDEIEAEIAFEHTPESGDGFHEPLQPEEIEILSVRAAGKDWLPAMTPRMVDAIERDAWEMVREGSFA